MRICHRWHCCLLADGFQIVLFVLIHDQRDIFNGGEYVNELEMLMNHADAQGIGIPSGCESQQAFH